MKAIFLYYRITFGKRAKRINKMVSQKKKITRKTQTAKSKYDSWLSIWWRPAMAWVYLLICICDFIVFPVLFGLYSLHVGSHLVQNWLPLTLQGGGLVHIAFGSVLGVTSYTRGTEKTAMINYQAQSYQPQSYQPQSYQSPSYQQYQQNAPYAPTGGFNDQDDTTQQQPQKPLKRPIPRIQT
jgi:hypothetical protein